jgi:hypothetical protein
MKVAREGLQLAAVLDIPEFMNVARRGRRAKRRKKNIPTRTSSGFGGYVERTRRSLQKSLLKRKESQN